MHRFIVTTTASCRHSVAILAQVAAQCCTPAWLSRYSTRCSLCRCGMCHWINVILLIDNGRVDETGSWVSNLHQDWFLSSEIYSACEECQFEISPLLEACMVEEII